MDFKVAGKIYHQNSIEDLVNWSRSIFNTLQVGILVIDAETKTVVDVNPAAALMIGLRRENIIGNSCTLYGCLGSKKGKCPVIDLGLDIEDEICTLSRKDGTKLNVQVTVTSALHNNKRYLIKSFVDVIDCVEKEEDWTEVEQVLSNNIAEIKSICKKNCVRDTARVKQDLRKALTVMMGG